MSYISERIKAVEYMKNFGMNSEQIDNGLKGFKAETLDEKHARLVSGELPDDLSDEDRARITELRDGLIVAQSTLERLDSLRTQGTWSLAEQSEQSSAQASFEQNLSLIEEVLQKHKLRQEASSEQKE